MSRIRVLQLIALVVMSIGLISSFSMKQIFASQAIQPDGPCPISSVERLSDDVGGTNPFHKQHRFVDFGIQRYVANDYYSTHTVIAPSTGPINIPSIGLVTDEFLSNWKKNLTISVYGPEAKNTAPSHIPVLYHHLDVYFRTYLFFFRQHDDLFDALRSKPASVIAIKCSFPNPEFHTDPLILQPIMVNPGQTFTPNITLVIDRGWITNDALNNRQDIFVTNDIDTYGYPSKSIPVTRSARECRGDEPKNFECIPDQDNVYHLVFPFPLTAPAVPGMHGSTIWQLSVKGQFVGPKIEIPFVVTDLPPPPPPPKKTAYTVTNVVYPPIVQPNQTFQPQVTVCVNRGMLLGSRGDMLRNTDGNLFGAWPFVVVQGQINADSCFTFVFNANNPMRAPVQPGQYTSRWKLWANGRFVDGTEVVIDFTVTNGSNGGPQVKLYSLANYGGSTVFSAGQGFSNANHNSYSMQIPDGWSAITYSDKNGNGDHQCWSQNVPNLQDYNWQNRINSIDVSTTNRCPSPHVELFRHPNFQDRLFSQGVGFYNGPDRTANSITVPLGMSAIAYRDKDRKGDQHCFDQSVPKLQDVGWDNAIASIEIFSTDLCNQGGPAVELFRHPNFQDRLFSQGVGFSNGPNSTAMSMTIPSGWSVWTWRNKNMGGADQRCWTQSVPNLGDYGWGNSVESIDIFNTNVCGQPSPAENATQFELYRRPNYDDRVMSADPGFSNGPNGIAYSMKIPRGWSAITYKGKDRTGESKCWILSVRDLQPYNWQAAIESVDIYDHDVCQNVTPTPSATSTDTKTLTNTATSTPTFHPPTTLAPASSTNTHTPTTTPNIVTKSATPTNYPMNIGLWCGNIKGADGNSYLINGIWQCKDGGGNMFPADLDAVCSWEHPGTHAVYSPSDPYNGKCFPGLPVATKTMTKTLLAPTHTPTMTPTSTTMPTSTFTPTIAYPLYPQAKSGSGVQFTVYCQTKYGPTATEYRVVGDATSWSCMLNGTRISLNFNQVCLEVRGYADPYMHIGNVADIGSLKCQSQP